MGTKFAEDWPIELDAGWSLVSYLPRRELAIAEALQSIDGQYFAVLGYDQEALSYYPHLAPNFNTLHTMKPLHGYWIKMNQAGTLRYPAATASLHSPTLRQRLGQVSNLVPNSFGLSPISNPTHAWVNFYGSAHQPDGTPLPVGTTVQALDPDGMVCGAALVATEGQYGLLACYGDDPATPKDEGAQPGDIIRLVVDGQEIATGIWTFHGDLREVNLGAEPVTRPWRLYLPFVWQDDR